MELIKNHTNEFTMDSFDNNALLSNPVRKASFGGVFKKQVEFIIEKQLKDVALWKRFIKQFTFPSDDDDRGWRCEYWGKMMRGATYIYAYSHDEELYAVLRDAVIGLLETQDELGRISSYSLEKELDGWDIWGRKYVLLGLQYFSEICEEDELRKTITASMCRQLDYLVAKLGVGEGKKKITDATRHWLGANSCSVLEPVVRLYNQTGKTEYLDFAKYIIDAASGNEGKLKIFKEALENEKIPSDYCENKAYETMSCFEGLIEYYRVTGEEVYKTMAENFARRVIENEISIIGSSGCTHELFDNTRLHQVDPAFNGIMQETCVSVTWLKFCGQLLRLTGDPVYADCIEHTFYNAYYGSFNTHGIDTVYVSTTNGEEYRYFLPFDSYSTLRPGTRGRKTGGLKKMVDGTLYGCCACIGAAGTGFVPPLAAMLSKNGVVWNFYFDGENTVLTPSGKELRIATNTLYPYADTVNMTVDSECGEEFTLSLRIPEWSKKTVLRVNGEQITAVNGYTDIRRVWNKGDKIEIIFDLRVTRIDPPADSAQKDDYVGLRRGAIILATDARLGVDPNAPVSIAFDVSTEVLP